MNWAQFKWSHVWGNAAVWLEALTTSCQLRQLYYFVITSLSSTQRPLNLLAWQGWGFLPLARPCGPSDDYWGISVLLRWGGGGQRTPPHQTEYLARALSESQPSTPTQNHPNKQTNMCVKHSRRLTGCKETGVLILGPVLHQFSRIIAKQSDESQPGGRHRDLKDTCNTDTDWRKELNPGGFFQFQKPTKLKKIIHLGSRMCED